MGSPYAHTVLLCPSNAPQPSILGGMRWERGYERRRHAYPCLCAWCRGERPERAGDGKLLNPAAPEPKQTRAAPGRTEDRILNALRELLGAGAETRAKVIAARAGLNSNVTAVTLNALKHKGKVFNANRRWHLREEGA